MWGTGMAIGFLCFLLLSYLSVTLLLKNSPLLCPTLQPSSRDILREEKPGRGRNRLSITGEKNVVASLRKTWPGLSLNGGGEKEIWEHQGISGELRRIFFVNTTCILSATKGLSASIYESPPQLKCFIPDYFTVELFIQFRRRIFIQVWEAWPILIPMPRATLDKYPDSEHFSLYSIWQLFLQILFRHVSI